MWHLTIYWWKIGSKCPITFLQTMENRTGHRTRVTRADRSWMCPDHFKVIIHHWKYRKTWDWQLPKAVRHGRTFFSQFAFGYWWGTHLTGRREACHTFTFNFAWIWFWPQMSHNRQDIKIKNFFGDMFTISAILMTKNAKLGEINSIVKAYIAGKLCEFAIIGTA